VRVFSAGSGFRVETCAAIPKRAHRHLHHSTLCSRVIKKKRIEGAAYVSRGSVKESVASLLAHKGTFWWFSRWSTTLSSKVNLTQHNSLECLMWSNFCHAPPKLWGSQNFRTPSSGRAFPTSDGRSKRMRQCVTLADQSQQTQRVPVLNSSPGAIGIWQGDHEQSCICICRRIILPDADGIELFAAADRCKHSSVRATHRAVLAFSSKSIFGIFLEAAAPAVFCVFFQADAPAL